MLANLGTLHFQTRALDQAGEELQGALVLLRQMQHPIGMAGVLTNLSFVHEAQQDYRAAYLYQENKMGKEVTLVDQRINEIERQADLSLMRLRGSMNTGLTGHPAKSGNVRRKQS